MVTNISSYLAQNNIKPSFQRIKVFEYLTEHMNHPTVDVIYQSLAPQIPTLSKTTVYNTLKLFSKKGIVNTITIEDNEVRFDVVTHEHAHFKCNICNSIFDINIEELKLNEQQLSNFSLDTTHVYIKGTCKLCLTKNKLKK